MPGKSNLAIDVGVESSPDTLFPKPDPSLVCKLPNYNFPVEDSQKDQYPTTCVNGDSEILGRENINVFGTLYVYGNLTLDNKGNAGDISYC